MNDSGLENQFLTFVSGYLCYTLPAMPKSALPIGFKNTNNGTKLKSF